MQFTLTRTELLQLLTPLMGVCDRKQTLPILGNVLISVENSRLSLIATDLEIELHVNAALQGEAIPGEITAPGRKLYEICKNLPESSSISFELDGEKLYISSSGSRFMLTTLPAVDFPTVQSISPKITLEMPQSRFCALIQGVQFAMANQDVRYYLNGVLFEGDGELLRMIATDGHRLALSSTTETPLQTNSKLHIILPRKAVTELTRILDDGSNAPISLQIDDNHIKIETDALVFISKLIDGRFPDYRRVLPQGGDKIVELDRDTLKQGLLRASILSSEKHRGVRMQLEPGWLRIFANNPEQEQAEEEIECPYEGDNFEIGFNASYLLDVLNTIPAGPVRLTMQDASCSTLIQSGVENVAYDNLYVVMPLRL